MDFPYSGNQQNVAQHFYPDPLLNTHFLQTLNYKKVVETIIPEKVCLILLSVIILNVVTPVLRLQLHS
jgi:hypothetical protein